MISNGLGIANITNFLPKVVYIVLQGGVENGSSLRIYIRRMGENMANAGDVRRKFAICVTGNGMA